MSDTEFKISINCPSYKRPKVETLDYLPSCKVWVDEGEYQDYIEANPKFKDNIISVPKGIQGNVSRIRNYILDMELPNNDAVLMVDDDLQMIESFEPEGEFGYKRCCWAEEDLYRMIEEYSILCKEFGFYFWGINPTTDKIDYRQFTPFSTKLFIGGPFQCFLQGCELRYDARLPLKEDYDMTLQNCQKYRGCLRVNKFHYICKQAEQAGGCATYRNYESEEAQLKLLQKKWGKKIVRTDRGLGKPRLQKKSTLFADFNPVIKIPIKGV